MVDAVAILNHLDGWHRVPLVLILFNFRLAESSIDCFKCVSINGNYPACEDPFHNNYTVDILESPCMGGRKNRNGLFPATACIKLTGKYGSRGQIGDYVNTTAKVWFTTFLDDTGDHIMVRGCALDSGTLTTDTEIIRMSHCGAFVFDDRYVRGCVQSCADADACNVSPRIVPNEFNLIYFVILLFMFSKFNLT